MAKKVAAAEPVEGPSALPDGWRWARLGSILPLAYGKALKATERRGGSVPVYGSSGVAGLHDEALCSEPALIVGRKGSAGAVFHAAGPSYAIDTAYYCSTSAARYDLRLGYHLLSFLDLRRLDQSTAVPSLSRDPYNELIVPVPPESKQPALAARIDELFAEIDDGEAALARTRDDLAMWRKALLKAAVTGELTTDWRAANPSAQSGSDLLSRILADRRDRWEMSAKDKDRWYVEPLAAVNAGLPAIPYNWAWASMGQLLDRIEAGLNVKCVERPPHGAETGLLKISAVTWWRFNERASKTLAESHVHPEQWLIADGDLLVSRANTLELVGAPAIVEGLSLRLMLSDKVLRLVMPAYLRRWTFYVMRSPLGRAWIESRSTGNQLSMRNISQDALRAIPIPMPPRPELDHIVELLDAASSEHERTAGDIGAVVSAAATLRLSILAAAFRGELA